MTLIILSFFLFTSFLFFYFMLQFFVHSDQRVEKRMKRYLSVSDEKLKSNHLRIFSHYQLAKQRIRKSLLSKQKNTKLETQLARSGLPIKPEEYIIFQWISTALCGCLFVLFTGKWLLLLVGFALGFFFPKWYLRKKQRERVEKFNDGLADMITTIVGSLRAGFSFPQALKAVIEEAGTPIKDEMDSVLKEMQYGSSLEDSLNDLKERMPSEDLDLMIQAILIQRQVGGNLATVLDKIVETIRDRNKIQRQIMTLTAQGRLSGIVIGLLPIILGLVLYLIQPGYIGTLFHNSIGLLMVAAGFTSGVIGFIMIKKITTIEV
ncbi:type II secretion system F family protein [Neobacillus sp. PS3-34]|uniref:type II secretion system F family protein n=1 Tax=Neobacillus sp. PS3-34 TaxID=3070678 RepID=UPI0027E1700C|nr:type II secretion system F family protein [Neobacillus sp. PS3-34]WML49610.1 type II secretion system F family protein [Neobacillus sp. PS3-34]